MVFELRKFATRVKRYDLKHKKIAILCKISIFRPDIFKLVYLGQNFLTFFFKMLQIKQGTIIFCSHNQKLHIWSFVGNLPRNNDHF
jgi:hypothetical protein